MIVRTTTYALYLEIQENREYSRGNNFSFEKTEVVARLVDSWHIEITILVPYSRTTVIKNKKLKKAV